MSRERVMLAEARPRGTGEPLQPPEWFEEQIANAQEEEREGLLKEALERVFRAREQNPPEELGLRLDELLGRLNRAVLELPTLVAWVEPAKDPIIVGEPVRVRVFFKNVGTVPVRVPLRIGKKAMRRRVEDRPSEEPSSKSMLVLEIIRRDHDLRAQILTSRRFRYEPLERELSIPAGGMTEVVVALRGAGNERTLDGLRVFRIGGRLQPAVIEVGGLRRWDPIRLEPATIRVFRENYEHLADDPVARITEASEKNAPAHVLTATGLVPLDRRQAAVDALVDALQGGRPVDWAIFAGLQYLTETELGRDPDMWRAWWPRVREGFFAPGAARKRDRDSPEFG